MSNTNVQSVILWSLVIVSLLSAFIIGNRLNNTNLQLLIEEKFSDYTVDYSDNDIYQLKSKSDTLFLSTYETIGYGGSMIVATAVDANGKIKNVEILHDTETFSYIRKLQKHSFFSQYENLDVAAPLEHGYDIDNVSGASISGKAIAKAAQRAGHHLAQNTFSREPIKTERSFEIEDYEWGILLFFIVSILLTFWLKKRIFKILTYSLSIVFLGLMWNSSLSIAFFSRILLGEIPDLNNGLLFWIFIGFISIGIIVFKRNFYCYSICPFFAVQYFLSKLTGLNWRLHPQLRRYTQYVNGLLLWAVLIVSLLKNNSTISSYEPFSMIFSLQGNGVQWFIFPLILIASMFVSQFFCRFFCPIGALSYYALKARKGKLFKTTITTCSNNIGPSKLLKLQSFIVSILYFLSLFAIIYYLIVSLKA